MSKSLATLPQEFLFQYALSLPLTDLYHLCQTNKLLNQLICDNDFFWHQKFIRDFTLVNYIGSWKTLY